MFTPAILIAIISVGPDANKRGVRPDYLSLSLFVLGILADHVDATLPPDSLAILADRFGARSYFHKTFPAEKMTLPCLGYIFIIIFSILVKADR
jgi:hypothetical protein